MSASTSPTALPTFADVQAASERLQGVAHRTPVLRSTTLNKLTFAVAFVFFGILVSFTMADYLGRGMFGVVGK